MAFTQNFGRMALIAGSGPIFRVESRDAFIRMLDPLDRAKAVETAWAAGAPYRQG